MDIPDWRVEVFQIYEEIERERWKWERMLDIELVPLNLDGLHEIINFQNAMRTLRLPPSRRNIEYLEQMLVRFYRNVIKPLGLRGKKLPKPYAKRFEDLFIRYVEWARYNRFLRRGRSTRRRVRKPKGEEWRRTVSIIPEKFFEYEEE